MLAFAWRDGITSVPKENPEDTTAISFPSESNIKLLDRHVLFWQTILSK